MTWLIVGWLICSVSAWKLLIDLWLRDFGEVMKGDLIMLTVLSVFGPVSLVAALLIRGIVLLDSLDDVVIRRKDG